MKYRYALTGVVLAAVLAAGIFFMKKTRPVSTASKTETNFPKAQGPVDAPIELIEYSDFQCPACQRAEASLKRIFDAYPGKIRFAFRHFPLPGHRWSPLAHQAAECAARKGKFWEFHDRLYANQQIWSQAPNAAEFFFPIRGRARAESGTVCQLFDRPGSP